MLIDFGCIKQVAATAQSQLTTGATSASATQVGKMGYAPGEIWQGVDHQTKRLYCDL